MASVIVDVIIWYIYLVLVGVFSMLGEFDAVGGREVSKLFTGDGLLSLEFELPLFSSFLLSCVICFA